MTETDIAWAAGLFEGEGHFRIRRRGPGYRSRFEMGLTSTDEDVVRRFAHIAGCGVVKHRARNRPHWKDQYVWIAQTPEARAFVNRLAPYLGVRRSDRLSEILLEVDATKPQPRECEHCGNTFTPTRFSRERFCSSRCRERSKYLRRVQGHIAGTRP